MSAKEQEDRIIEFWERQKIYEKAKKQNKGKKKFYFLDGPPYATGAIHMGTAINKILKDFYIRFYRMNGFDVWDQPGFDTHGVPIENKVEKKFGFRTKKDIEKFGVEKFVDECKKFATEFVGLNSKQFANLGVWMDWKNPYLTLTNEYIEGAWYTFKKAFEKGFLYKGDYSVHVCPHCETVVAYNEIEYDKAEDPSIYVKFKVEGKKNEYLLIWTTTPWTLPSNTGVMVNPEADYVKVRVGDEIWYVSHRLLEGLMKKFEITKYEIVERMKGKSLEGLRYEHPLKDLFVFQQNLKNAHRIVLSEKYVSLEDGTGLVHTAPGHGAEDYKVGMENKLPIVNPLKLDGTFNEKSSIVSGVFAKDADEIILGELEKRKLLVHREKIVHDYPFCWRCHSPLLMMAVPQWFFKVTEIRSKLLEENRKVHWIPDWAGARFENWLESLGDWPVSRQRYWGIPLPIWVCENCGETKVIGSRDELPKVPKDFHRPHIDSVTFVCKNCKGTMRRVSDVLDVWFDAGVASWATLGYPGNKKLFNKWWPADFILEGPDQIRGWWNSQMITSMMTFDRRPFNEVLFHGFVLDAHGVKMSKSAGNIVAPEDVIQKHGRDTLRFFALSNLPWEDFYFKWEDVDYISKKLVVVRNTFNFVKTYVTDKGLARNLQKEDKWMLSRLNSLLLSVPQSINGKYAYKAAQDILNFILEDLSRWYIKLVRDRTWVLYKGADKKAAFHILYTVVESALRLLAPFTPFLADDVYQSCVKPIDKKSSKSVHFLEWPKPNKKLIDKKLEEEMQVAKKIVEYSNAARQLANIKLRWPVGKIFIQTKDKQTIATVKNLQKILTRMCNCKRVETVKVKPDGDFAEAVFDYGTIYVNKILDEKLMEEAMLKELVRHIQDMRKKNKFEVKELISLSVEADKDISDTILKNKKFLMQEVGARKVVVGKLSGNYKSELDFEDKKISVAFSKVN